jgi:hypothetical protein
VLAVGDMPLSGDVMHLTLRARCERVGPRMDHGFRTTVAVEVAVLSKVKARRIVVATSVGVLAMAAVTLELRIPGCNPWSFAPRIGTLLTAWPMAPAVPIHYLPLDLMTGRSAMRACRFFSCG